MTRLDVKKVKGIAASTPTNIIELLIMTKSPYWLPQFQFTL